MTKMKPGDGLRARRTPEEWQARLGTSALDPLQVMDLQDAIKAKKKTADLQGRLFNLRYYRENGEDKVYYSPVEGYTPTGHLLVNRILGDM